MMELDPQELAHVLAIWPVARLASLGSDGRPHLVPIVFAALDGLIYSPVDGKSKSGTMLRRLRNVAEHRAVALLLDHYDADWRALWWLRIDANADVVGIDQLGDAALQRLAAQLRMKYPQYDDVAVFRGAPTLLRIQPVRHVAWSAQPIHWQALTRPRGAIDE